MTRQEKSDLIDQFEAGGSAFADTADMSRDLLTFRPFPEAWTIHEQVIHFLESDITAFHRYRRAVAEPDTQVLGYDEEIWTKKLDYHKQDLGLALSLIHVIRQFMASHLRTLVDDDWTAYAYTHSVAGRVNLESFIKTYTDHVRFHRELIDRNMAAFAKK